MFWVRRVATVREKVLENEKCSRSGNFIFSQGNLEYMCKSKKSGNFKNFKKLLVNWLLVFHKLQAILEKEFVPYCYKQLEPFIIEI